MAGPVIWHSETSHRVWGSMSAPDAIVCGAPPAGDGAYTGTGGRIRKRASARRNGSAQGQCERGAQGRDARTADQAARDREEPGAHGARHGEVLGRGDLAEHGGPADEVVGERGADEPGRVGEEVSRGHVLEARPFFEVADGELDAGVVAVERVDVDGSLLRGR